MSETIKKNSSTIPILQTTGDLEIKTGGKGQFQSGAKFDYSEYVVRANGATEADFKGTYAHNPYFNTRKNNDEVFKFLQAPDIFGFANQTEQDLPGMGKGEKLDCR